MCPRPFDGITELIEKLKKEIYSYWLWLQEKEKRAVR